MEPSAAFAIEPSARAAEPGAVTVLTVAAPLLPVERFLALPLKGEALLWADPDEDRWSFAGRGEAARVEAAGEGRFEAVRDEAAALLAQVSEHHGAGAAFALPPAFFGGFSFDEAPPSAFDDAPWASFGGASFVLPRWVYGRRKGQAFLRLALREGASGRDPHAEIGRAVRAIAELACSSEGGASAAGEPAPRVEALAPAIWEALVEAALGRIRAGEVEKIVAARRSRIVAAETIDVRRVLSRLRRDHPACLSFAFERGPATFFGATPERLVTVRGLAIDAEALAGSIARGTSGSGAEASALLGSDKDRREQSLVVRGVRDALAPFCTELTVPDAPSVRSLANVHHLATLIQGRLRRPQHVLDAVRALHPTPAVGGSPKRAAASWIAANEPAPRGWYAGPIGWFDGAGDGAFSVAIRSGIAEGARAWVYAGAGIVRGSDPALEYEETRVKQAAVLAALGASP